MGPAPKGFFHSYTLREVIYVVIMKHPMHLLYPGREKLTQNLLNLENIPPARTVTGLLSIIPLRTLSFVLQKNRSATPKAKLGRTWCRGQKRTQRKAQTHRRLLQKMVLPAGKQLEVKSAAQC